MANDKSKGKKGTWNNQLSDKFKELKKSGFSPRKQLRIGVQLKGLALIGRDGEDHINVTRIAESDIGKNISMAMSRRFKHDVVGVFNSFHSFVQWLSSGFDDTCRYGGRTTNKERVKIDNYFAVLAEALYQCLAAMPDKAVKSFAESTLALDYYNNIDGIITRPNMASFYVHMLESIRKAFRTGEHLDLYEFLDENERKSIDALPEEERALAVRTAAFSVYTPLLKARVEPTRQKRDNHDKTQKPHREKQEKDSDPASQNGYIQVKDPWIRNLVRAVTKCRALQVESVDSYIDLFVPIDDNDAQNLVGVGIEFVHTNANISKDQSLYVVYVRFSGDAASAALATGVVVITNDAGDMIEKVYKEARLALHVSKKDNNLISVIADSKNLYESVKSLFGKVLNTWACPERMNTIVTARRYVYDTYGHDKDRETDWIVVRQAEMENFFNPYILKHYIQRGDDGTKISMRDLLARLQGERSEEANEMLTSINNGTNEFCVLYRDKDLYLVGKDDREIYAHLCHKTLTFPTYRLKGHDRDSARQIMNTVLYSCAREWPNFGKIQELALNTSRRSLYQVLSRVLNEVGKDFSGDEIGPVSLRFNHKDSASYFVYHGKDKSLPGIMEVEFSEESKKPLIELSNACTEKEILNYYSGVYSETMERLEYSIETESPDAGTYDGYKLTYVTQAQDTEQPPVESVEEDHVENDDPEDEVVEEITDEELEAVSAEIVDAFMKAMDTSSSSSETGKEPDSALQEVIEDAATETLDETEDDLQGTMKEALEETNEETRQEKEKPESFLKPRIDNVVNNISKELFGSLNKLDNVRAGYVQTDGSNITIQYKAERIDDALIEFSFIYIGGAVPGQRADGLVYKATAKLDPKQTNPYSAAFSVDEEVDPVLEKLELLCRLN